MKKVLILNGPPNCGKDTIADRIERQYGWRHRRFKDRLYEIASFRTGEINLGRFVRLCTDRDKKDIPYAKFVDEYEGMTPRQALIHVSENVIKPLKGEDYFGKELARSINSEWTVVSDGGFIEEIEPLVEEDIKVYIAQLSRHNCSFEGDSRGYVYPKNCECKGFHNNSQISEVIEDIMDWIDGEEQ